MSSEILLGGKGGVDKNGFLSRTLHFKVDVEADALTVGPATFLGVPQKSGGRSWEPIPDGRFKVMVDYEGLVSEKDPEAPENFKVIKMRSTEPVESHPAIASLTEEFSGTEDAETRKLRFPLFYSPTQSTATGLGSPLTLDSYKPAQYGPNKEKNPMAGRETYWRFGLMVRWTFGTKTFPSNWADRDGVVLETIPGPIRKRPGHNWLSLVNEITPRGSGESLGWETSIDFILSEKGGWPPLYTILEKDY